MTASRPPVRLMLDRSALLAYLAGSMHVAEPVHEVTYDGVLFGVTAVTAAETLAMVNDGGDRAALRRLLELDACRVLPTHADGWHELAYWRRATGRLDLAATVMAALEYDAPMLTAEDKLYGDQLPLIHFPA